MDWLNTHTDTILENGMKFLFSPDPYVQVCLIFLAVLTAWMVSKTLSKQVKRFGEVDDKGTFSGFRSFIL